MPLQPFARGVLAEAAGPKDVKGKRSNFSLAVFLVQVILHARHHIVVVEDVAAVDLLRKRGRSLSMPVRPARLAAALASGGEL
jgi:hypothetical protein